MSQDQVQSRDYPTAPSLQDKVIQALRTCYDPEIPVNIYDLGLVYDLKADQEAGDVYIKMTLTAPSCPVAGMIPKQVERAVQRVPGVKSVQVDLVWEPPWDRSMMSDAAKLQLGLDIGFGDIVPLSQLES
jgi:FeS assembly SUF system protein